MPRIRRKANNGWSTKTSHEDDPKWLVPAVASLILFLALWADHGNLAEDVAATSGASVWQGSDAPSRPRTVARKASLISRPAVKEPPLRPIERKKRLTYQEFAEKYDGQRPVIVENVASNWSATKDWSRKRFANAYRNEMLVLTVTQSGLNKREVMVAPVKELNYYAQNASVESWAMVEDDYFIVLRPKLLKGLGSIKFAHNNLFKHFPENCRPASHTLIWGSVFSRSVLRVAAFNSTSVHVLLRGRRTWKLFPPSQSKYLHLEPDGVLSGLTLQFHAYASPVDAFMPDSERHPQFHLATPMVFEQRAGEMLVVPHGWFAQWFSNTETLGTVTQLLNEKNFDVVLSEIMKVQDQVNWSDLPLELESLAPERQIQAVMDNLVDSVHWRANLTRSAMLMQFGGNLHKGRAGGDTQPLKILQDAILNNPQLLSTAGLSSDPNPPNQQCSQQASVPQLMQELFKNRDLVPQLGELPHSFFADQMTT